MIFKSPSLIKGLEKLHCTEDNRLQFWDSWRRECNEPSIAYIDEAQQKWKIWPFKYIWPSYSYQKFRREPNDVLAGEHRLILFEVGPT